MIALISNVNIFFPNRIALILKPPFGMGNLMSASLAPRHYSVS